MSKKKKKSSKPQQPPMSPAKYLREKARTLEIGKCYISNDIDKVGIGSIVVTRLHKNGKMTMGVYLVDIFCLGVKDASYRFRMDETELGELKEMIAMTGIRECSYEEAHNRIYGAIAFAEEGGIRPHHGFALAQYILEEDTDDVPLIEYEYGKNGKHFLVVESKFEASKYVPTLQKNLGDNFEVIIRVDEDEQEDEDNLDFVDTDYIKRYSHQ